MHGSRGIANRALSNSDIDLSMIVDIKVLSTQSDIKTFLCDVSETTLSVWRSQVELDIAIVFDIRDCGLKCFHKSVFDEQLCAKGGVDCFGLYKT